MKKTRLYFLQGLIILFMTIASQGGETEEGEGRFRLLSEIQNGVTYVKNPCHPGIFSLVFSFSKELRGPMGEEIAFISFSEAFEDFLKIQHEEMKTVALYARVPEKIGSRQLRVDYIAKIVREDGSDVNLDLPDQIEVVILNEDLSKVFDQSNRSCEKVPNNEREMTLLLSNPYETCGAYPH